MFSAKTNKCLVKFEHIPRGTGHMRNALLFAMIGVIGCTTKSGQPRNLGSFHFFWA